jgi:hypothetical protein
MTEFETYTKVWLADIETSSVIKCIVIEETEDDSPFAHIKNWEATWKKWVRKDEIFLNEKNAIMSLGLMLSLEHIRNSDRPKN